MKGKDYGDTGRDLGAASTTRVTSDPKMTRLRRPQLARRRKAAAWRGARTLGPYTAVQLELRRTRGLGGGMHWIEVTCRTGRWYVNHDAAVGDLVDQLIRGGHWVR